MLIKSLLYNEAYNSNTIAVIYFYSYFVKNNKSSDKAHLQMLQIKTFKVTMLNVVTNSVWRMLNK